MKKCKGCGAILQSEDENKIGFVKNIEKNLCERCFRIQNYSDYKMITKDNDEYINILKSVNKTSDLVILVADIFLLNQNLTDIKNYLKNPILLVLTKRDLLPLKISDEKLLSYFNFENFNIVDKEIISSYKNYNFDSLYEKIKKFKKSKNVYVVGYTNAGKSTMINKLIYNYSNKNTQLTTSLMPSTTLDQIEIELNEDLTLIDTPGLLISHSLMNYLSGMELNKVLPKKEIKPITYQIKSNQWIMIDEFCLFEALKDNNITIYVSNGLNISRYYTMPTIDKYYEKKIKIKNNQDLVFEGLGFIHFQKECVITVYTKYDISVYTRKKLI